MGQKDVDPLFKLPAEGVKDLAEELSEFELLAKQLGAEAIDEFHSQTSEIHHGGRDHHSSISSEPPVVPQHLSGSSIAASSEDSENNQSFVQSPGSARSNSSSPEELFDDELLDEMLQDPPEEDDGVTGSAANLIPEPEPRKLRNQEDQRTKTMMNQKREMLILQKLTPLPENRKNKKLGKGGDTRENKYPPHPSTEATRRRSSRRSIPTDRYSTEFKLPENPRSKRGARSSIAPSLKSLKAALKESWAQRPDSTAPLRRRSKSRESSSSTRTRAASLERMQTGSWPGELGLRSRLGRSEAWEKELVVDQPFR